MGTPSNSGGARHRTKGGLGHKKSKTPSHKAKAKTQRNHLRRHSSSGGSGGHHHGGHSH